MRPDSVIIDLPAETKWEAIDELLAALDRQGLVADADRARADILARENKMSTGLENGLAIPHAKSTGARELALALGIRPAGLPFDSLDGRPAQVIFLIVSRKDTAGPHIQCMSEIVSLYARQEVRSALLAAKTSAEVIGVLSGAKAR